MADNSNSGLFDANFFRTQIRETMVMGLPSVSERATFVWPEEKTYAVATDPKGRPYDLGAAPTATTTHPDLQVPVAVEFTGGSVTRTAYTQAGEEDAVRVIITALDVDYVLIKDYPHVLLGENTYKIDYWAPPVALFSVSVYQAYCSAMDES